MPWDSTAADLGFGSGATRPWLPLAESHRPLAVDRQEADARSLLHHYRRRLEWRRSSLALVRGTIELLPAHPQVLAYVRQHDGERLLCAFNLGDQPARFDLRPGDDIVELLDAPGMALAAVAGTRAEFEPWGVLFARLA